MTAGLEAAYRQVLPGGRSPYGFQVHVGERLLAGDNVVLQAPTGCGKTLAALVPYVIGRQQGRFSRLIYCLPLRTLARAIQGEAARACDRLAPGLAVRMQTGEQPDDPFFSEADIVVCTYDQLLSGMLGGPYGLSQRLANVNAACVCGALVVFDEFHLMAADRAFLTGAACLAQFGNLTQSLWMSATATAPLVTELASALGAVTAQLRAEELASLPSVSRCQRTLHWHGHALTAAAVQQLAADRVIVIVNQVERAQQLFRELGGSDGGARLLHARFFRADRDGTEAWLRERFGHDGCGPAVAVCTQVIEAGIDITSDALLSELCPVNALIQRAGRCARFPLADAAALTTGAVHVFDLPSVDGSHLPYPDEAIRTTRCILQRDAGDPVVLTTDRVRLWVEEAHAGDDAASLGQGWRSRQEQVLQQVVRPNVFGGPVVGVSDLIREADDSVRVIVADPPPEDPATREPLQLRRGRVRRLLADSDSAAGWSWFPDGEGEAWKPLDNSTLTHAYFVCLRPSLARYDPDVGLEIGLPGSVQSPQRVPPRRPGYGGLAAESWVDHTRGVVEEGQRRARRELPARSTTVNGLAPGVDYIGFLAAVRLACLFHDFGKLQLGWQRWAISYQQLREPGSSVPPPLAHTRFNPRDPADGVLERRITAELGRRPPHAAVGALFAAWAGGPLLQQIPGEAALALLSAACAAIAGHHGGWVPEPSDLGAQPLSAEWFAVVPYLTHEGVDRGQVQQAEADAGKRRSLLEVLDCTAGPDALGRFWPLIALISRVLRLSDQKATEAGRADG